METFLPYSFSTSVRFTDKLAALNTLTVEHAPYTKCSIYNTRWHTKGRIPWAPKAGDINHSNAVFRSEGSVGWKVFACASNKPSRVSEYLKLSICPILTLVHSLILSSLLRQLHTLFQSEFTTQGDLVLPLPSSTTLSFPQGHPVAAYLIFSVFQSFLPFPLSFLL